MRRKDKEELDNRLGPWPEPSGLRRGRGALAPRRPRGRDEPLRGLHDLPLPHSRKKGEEKKNKAPKLRSLRGPE